MKQRSLLSTLLIAGSLSALPVLAQAQRGRNEYLRANSNNGHGNNDKGQGNNDRPGNPGNAPGHNKNAPFDTGIGILIAAGAAYGLKKAYDKRKKDALTQ